MEIRNLLVAFFLLAGYLSRSQISIGFNSPSQVCINEPLSIQNTSVSADSYLWNFCLPNYDSAFPSNKITDASIRQSFDIEIDSSGGQWFGFIANRTGDDIIKLTFGNDLRNSPVISSLGGFSLLNDPMNIRLIYDGVNWFGFVNSFVNSQFVRLDFGASLNNIPTATNLGNFGTINSSIGLWVGFDNGSYKAVITNNSNANITILDFGSSLTNTPSSTVFSTTGTLNNRGIGLYKHSGNWHGIINSKGNNKIYHLDFGSSITNAITQTEIINAGFSFVAPSGLRVTSHGDEVLVYSMSES
ncbi:MAG: hypothetical protein OEY34_02885, partial [Cyclobacteriaceae bacterium]|nr:hypothetical protein [Cyclobacteriaceae bacterium]